MENVSASSTHTPPRADGLPARPDEVQASDAPALGATLDQLTEIADRERGVVSTELAEQLRDMADCIGRDPAIEQAKHVLRQRYAITGGEAFEMLRHVSQTSNRKVRDVARDVLANLG